MKWLKLDLDLLLLSNSLKENIFFNLLIVLFISLLSPEIVPFKPSFAIIIVPLIFF